MCIMSLSLVCLQLTVNSVMDFFRTGKGVDLEVLTSATLSKLEEIKEKTAAGLFSAAEQLIKGFPLLTDCLYRFVPHH